MVNLDLSLIQNNDINIANPNKMICNSKYYTESIRFIINMNNAIFELQKILLKYKYSDLTYNSYEIITDFKNKTLRKLKEHISDQYLNFTAINYDNLNEINYHNNIDLSSKIEWDSLDMENNKLTIIDYIYKIIKLNEGDMTSYPKRIKNDLFFILDIMIDNRPKILFGNDPSNKDIYALQNIIRIVPIFYSLLLSIVEEHISESCSLKEAVQTSIVPFITKKASSKILGFVDKFTDMNTELNYINKTIPSLENELKKAEDSLTEYKNIPISERQKEASKLNNIVSIVKTISFICQAISGITFIVINTSEIDTYKIIKDAESNINKGKRVLKYMYKRKKQLEKNMDKHKLVNKIFVKGGKN